MGEALYDEIVGSARLNANCRIYAPVGRHDDLVSYLVRRLLENGANTSFVNRLADDQAHIDEILRDPVQAVERERGKTVRLLPRPMDIFSPERLNSRGIALTEPTVRAAFFAEVAAELNGSFEASSIVGGEMRTQQVADLVLCPHDRRERIGVVHTADPGTVETALQNAVAATLPWDMLGGEARADILDKAAHLYERHRARLIGVMVREAGKTLENALADLREAIDFLRYYAYEARRQFEKPADDERPDRRDQHAHPARTRPLRLHQPLELSAGDLHGPGGGRARSRQSGARQAGRADAHHRLPRHAASARGRRARRRAAAPARRRRGRRRARPRYARRRRRLHRLQRHGRLDPAGARPARRTDRSPSSPRRAASMP